MSERRRKKRKFNVVCVVEKRNSVGKNLQPPHIQNPSSEKFLPKLVPVSNWITTHGSSALDRHVTSEAGFWEKSLLATREDYFIRIATARRVLIMIFFFPEVYQ